MLSGAARKGDAILTGRMRAPYPGREDTGPILTGRTHSAPLTPHPSLLTPHPSLLTPHPSLAPSQSLVCAHLPSHPCSLARGPCSRLATVTCVQVLHIPALIKRYIMKGTHTAIWQQRNRGGRRKLTLCLVLELTPSTLLHLTALVQGLFVLLAALQRMQYQVHIAIT